MLKLNGIPDSICLDKYIVLADKTNSYSDLQEALIDSCRTSEPIRSSLLESGLFGILKTISTADYREPSDELKELVMLVLVGASELQTQDTNHLKFDYVNHLYELLAESDEKVTGLSLTELGAIKDRKESLFANKKKSVGIMTGPRIEDISYESVLISAESDSSIKHICSLQTVASAKLVGKIYAAHVGYTTICDSQVETNNPKTFEMLEAEYQKVTERAESILNTMLIHEILNRCVDREFAESGMFL